MTARSLALVALLAGAAHAQEAPVAEAELAYRQGRFAEAAQVLERAIAAAPDDPEAHYLLARVLYDPDNPSRNEGAAGREIERAIELDPDNALYLSARLEHLRGDTWNFFQEMVRLQQRKRLALEILEIDPDNGVAHEELGIQALFDYYTYRNAISFPGLRFAAATRNVADPAEAEPGNENNTDGDQNLLLEAADPFTSTNTLYEPGAIATPNRFAIDRLRESGAAVLSYRRRADAAYGEAVRHLRQAVDADPRRREVYDHLIRLAVLSGRYAEVAPDIQEMYVQFPEDPTMWLYLGLVGHRLSQYEAADVAFREALDRMGDETRAAFSDLRLILPPEEHAAYLADPDAYAQRYWTSRDPRFLNAANERRTEHYARLTTADLLYRSDRLGIPGWDTERGRLHVRYGLPVSDVVIEGGFGEILQQYVDRDPSYLGSAMEVTANRFNVWDYGDFTLVFEDPNRNGEFRLYSPPADLYALSNAREVYRMDFAQQAEERVRETPERYTFEAPGRQVELPYRVTAFKGEGGETDLYVNYGIPIAADPEAGEGVQPDVDVTVKTGAFLIGPSRDLQVERRRTVYGLRGAQIVPFEQTRLWTSTEAMTATPGDYEVSLEFETASGGTSAVQRRAVAVPDYSGDALQLSDLLLAYYVEEADAPEPGRVFRDGVSAQPAPWGVFGGDDPVFLLFEVYGLDLRDGRSDYEVEARLVPKDTSRGLRRLARRVFGGGDPAVSTAFEAQGDRADETQYLSLDAAGQDPGLYTLTVTVRDRVSGETAEQETDLLLE